MDTLRICPQCHKPLPPEAPQGLCPECLLKAGLASAATTLPNTGSAAPPAPADLAAHFPQLEILELLGAGGMGMVYKARQPQLDRLVALKILSPDIAAKDAAFAERFLREARALARLNHPNIVAVFDFGQAGSFYYFIMEFVDGANLREFLANHQVSPREALAIVPKICDALQFAHDEGVMHRDIKPENILLDRKGRVKIADFGLAKLFGAGHAAHSTLTNTGVVMGTPRYMAPEQIEKPQTVDHRADIYSLGVIFYEMLTGELPIGRFEPPSHKVGVDVRLDEVVLRSLEKKPERRYQRASEVKTDVESISNTASVRPASPAPDTDSDAVRERVSAAAQKPLQGEIAGQTSQQPLRSAAADRLVRGPVLGLVAAGVLNWIGGIAAFILLALITDRSKAMDAWIGAAAILMMLLSATMFLGAVKMRRLENYRLAFASSIIAMVASPGNIIGLPVGIWSLAVLSRREVKEAFRATTSAQKPHAVSLLAPNPPRPRFSRKAIIGAVWAMFTLLALPSYFVARPVIDAREAQPIGHRIEVASLAPMPLPASMLAQAAPPQQPSSWGERSKPTIMFPLAILLMVLGLTAPIGTTVLGLVAIHDIRHSKGMITGLPLALADALLFPLVAFDGLLYWFCHLANRVALEIAPASALFRNETLVLPTAIVLWLVFDSFLIWLAWRTAKKPITTL